MESGYAFLHPRNVFERASGDELEHNYASIPFSPWRPCLPFLERRIPPKGPLTLLFRYLRVSWVFLTLSTWLGVVSLFLYVVPPSFSSRYVGYALWPRRKGWTTWQCFTYPVLSRLLWAITFGLPPAASPVTTRSVPILAKLWYGRGTSMLPVDLAFDSRDESKRWIQDEALDPTGKITLQKEIAGFWIRSEKAGKQSTREDLAASNPPSGDLQVVLYAVGGGYITGHPLEASRVFDIAHLTSLPVLGVNYRKSVSADTAFPAPLQDVIAAYAYLVRAGYTRIALAGDSAGAGLGCALMQYLARLSEKPTSERPDKLLMPTRVCWYSPWGDLTFSHPYREAVHFDIIHPTMLSQAAAAYTSGTNKRYHGAAATSAPRESIARLGRSHPYFSPALKSSMASLQRIAGASRALKQNPPRIIIFSGGAEVFSAECDALAGNLRVAGLEVEEYKEEDEMHGFLLVPTFMSDKVAPALDRMRTFLTSG